MKKKLLLPAVLPVLLVCVLAGCFGPKKSTASKEERERKEQEERRHRKKGELKRVEKQNSFEEEEDGDERYDGILAAQQREFDMTHDPATNTVPKDRLINALAKRNQMLAQQGTLRNGLSTTNGTTTTIDATSWIERGPYKDYPGPYGNPRDSIASTSGRIAALWADTDPTKPNQVFIGGIDGGLWSCPDITASAPAWTFIDNFSNLAISSICQDPTNTSIMYFGTGEHTINLDAVRGGGVWKSTDHGVTWTLLSTTTTFYNVSKVLCDKYGNLYVATTLSYGTGTGVGLRRSSDGGNTWTDITPTVGSLVTKQVSDMVYDPINDKMGVYMGYYPNSTSIRTGFVYSRSPSTVTSSTWLQPSSSVTTGGGMAIATSTSANSLYQTILAVKNNVFWALRSNYGTTALYLYRSVDGGDTWTLQGSALSSTIYGAGQGWYSIGMDCDPQNPSTNIIIGGLNVFKSTDGGLTFSQVSEWISEANAGAPAQYVHADVHNIFYNTTAAGQNRVLVCSDGGIFYSANGGSNWADRNVGLRLKQFYSCAINPSMSDYYLAGAQDNGSHQFKQPGLGASTEVNGGDGAIVAIDQLNPDNQITSYVYNYYHISTDGGNNWSSNAFGSSVGQFINPFDFDNKTKKMYAAYSAGTYLRWDDPTTTQYNTTSISVSSVTGSNILTTVTVSPNLANTIYVGGGGKVAKVVNANTNSPTVTNITPAGSTGAISSIVLGPSTSDQDIIVTSSSYGTKKVFVSADGGTTWTEITGNLPDMPVRWALFFPNSNTQAYLATEAGMWYTTAFNGASTVWQPSAGFPAVRCDMIKYAPSNGTIAVGTHGRGLWTTKYSTVPKVSFYSSLINISKSIGSATSGCRTYYDYSDTLLISDAPSGTATATISVQAGATAQQGMDFDFTTNGSFSSPSTTAVFNNGVINRIPVTVRIYNNRDKNASYPQTANLTYTLTGTTDATISPTNQTLAINLTDLIPTAKTLWTEDWESWPATSSSWTFIPSITFSSTSNPASVPGFIPVDNYGCAGPIANITAQMFSTDATGAVAYCANRSGAYTATMYRAVRAADTHATNMRVTFNYKSSANTNITNSLAYSLDNGSTWTTIATYALTANSVATTAIPTLLDNTNFLLGWRSVGTASATQSTYGFEVDNIVVQAGIPIDSTAASTSSNYEFASQSIDFLSSNSNIFANIANPSANLGCVTASIENAGNSWQSFSNGTRSQKTFLITPSTNGSTATYNATLYFTTAELAGKSPSALRIAKTSVSDLSLANSSNSVIVTPTTTTYSTYGISFSGAFTGFSRFFLVDNSVILPITLTDFKASLINGNSELVWTTSMEQNNHQFDVEVSTDGTSFVKLGTVLSQGNSTADQSYSYTHIKPAPGIYYYRLKQVDNDGRFTYTKIIAININSGSSRVFLYPVPASKTVTLNFGTIVKEATINLYSNDMKLLRTENITEALVAKDLDISQLPAGVYFVRVTTANSTSETLRFVKQGN